MPHTPAASTGAQISTKQMSAALRMMLSFVNNALKQRALGVLQPTDEIIKEVQQLAAASHPPSSSPSSSSSPTAVAESLHKLQLWLEAMAMCVSNFSRADMRLIDAVLAVPWMMRSDDVVASYIHFVENLISAQSYFIVPVIKRLVGGFHYRHNTDGVPLDTYYERVHIALSNVLALIPTGPQVVVAQLADKFPHKSQPLIDQQCYIQNILKMLSYAPVLREQMIALIVEKVLQIDVEIQVEVDEIEESPDMMFAMEEQEHAKSQSSRTGDGGDESDNDDDDGDSSEGGFGSDSDDGDDLTPATVLSVSGLVAKLDHIMDLLFNYIAQNVRPATATQVDEAALYELYSIFTHAFERSILPTYKSRHTQFLLFYLCSLNPALSDDFLGLLARKIVDTAAPPILRVTAALYMASFVARASYLPPSVVRNCFLLLVQWSQAYVEKNEAPDTFPDVERYGVFYAVTQAVLYIFCFRWRELLQDEDEDECNEEGGGDAANNGGGGGGGGGLGRFAGLQNFQSVIMSRFNPLKILLPPVVNEFARVTHINNIMYCYSVIERNKRVYLPARSTPHLFASQFAGNGQGANRSPGGHHHHHQTTVNNSAMLDAFFPFDPYRLSISARFIDPLYTNWGSASGNSDDQSDNDDDDTHAGHSRTRTTRTGSGSSVSSYHSAASSVHSDDGGAALRSHPSTPSRHIPSLPTSPRPARDANAMSWAESAVVAPGGQQWTQEEKVLQLGIDAMSISPYAEKEGHRLLMAHLTPLISVQGTTHH
ncbi:DNA independent RNA polymerase I transcription factor [Sorochytrium milnesiophthora]